MKTTLFFSYSIQLYNFEFFFFFQFSNLKQLQKIQDNIFIIENYYIQIYWTNILILVDIVILYSPS